MNRSRSFGSGTTMFIAALGLSGSGCLGATPAPKVASGPCAIERAFPYPTQGSYVGVHANALNNDFVNCELPDAWSEDWHALSGYAIAQPNTFSVDGLTTYVTTSDPEGDGCTVFAVDVEDGSTRWCVPVPGAIASSVEVDLDGNLYVVGDDAMLSFDPRGQTRWQVDMPSGATGVHFVPAGHVVTVTNDGVVQLHRRSDGEQVGMLDLADAFGFVPPRDIGLDLDLETNLPSAVLADFTSLHGATGPSDGLFKFAGSGGKFSDNTVGVAPNGDIYVVGGGPDEDHGALMQVRAKGSGPDLSLEAGWYVEIERGSASSPSISPDGRWVKVTDGNSAAGLVTPETVMASAHVVDIAACNANDDDDPAPEACAAMHRPSLLSGPTLGATPVLAGAEHYVFEVQLAALFDTTTPDVRAFAGSNVVWETLLPGDHQWSSVLTITQSHIVGTMTSVSASTEKLLTITLPETAKSELVVLRRSDGQVVFRAPVSDDSTATVSVGPDGSLYVGMLALLHTFATNTRPEGGLIRFRPEPPASE